MINKTLIALVVLTLLCAFTVAQFMQSSYHSEYVEYKNGKMKKHVQHDSKQKCRFNKKTGRIQCKKQKIGTKKLCVSSFDNGKVVCGRTAEQEEGFYKDHQYHKVIPKQQIVPNRDSCVLSSNQRIVCGTIVALPASKKKQQLPVNQGEPERQVRKFHQHKILDDGTEEEEEVEEEEEYLM